MFFLVLRPKITLCKAEPRFVLHNQHPIPSLHIREKGVGFVAQVPEPQPFLPPEQLFQPLGHDVFDSS